MNQSPAQFDATRHLRPLTLPAGLLALLCAALWGGVAVGSSYAQDAFPPVLTGGLRFLLGGIVIALWFLARGVPLRVPRHEWRPILVTGGIVWLQIALFHWGVGLTSSSHTSVLIGTNPLWIPLLAHFCLPGDRLSLRKVLGVLAATAGVVLVMGSTAATTASQPRQLDPATLLGDAVVLASAWLLTAKIVYNKAVLHAVHPARLVLWSNLAAAAALLFTSACLEPWTSLRPDGPALAGLFYAGVVISGFCFAAWSWLLQRHRASQLSVFGFAQPLFGVVFGWLLRGDAISAWLLWGAVAVAAGIVLVTREPAAEEPLPKAQPSPE